MFSNKLNSDYTKNIPKEKQLHFISPNDARQIIKSDDTFIARFIQFIMKDHVKLIDLLETTSEKISLTHKVLDDGNKECTIDLVLLIADSEYDDNIKLKIFKELCEIVDSDELHDVVCERYIYSHNFDISFIRIVNLKKQIADKTIIYYIFNNMLKYDESDENENCMCIFFEIFPDIVDEGVCIFLNHIRKNVYVFFYDVIKFFYKHMKEKFDEDFMNDKLKNSDSYFNYFVMSSICDNEKENKPSDFFKELFQNNYNFLTDGFYKLFEEGHDKIIEFVYSAKPELGSILLDNLSASCLNSERKNIIHITKLLLSENKVEINILENIAGKLPEILLFMIDELNLIDLNTSGNSILSKYIWDKRFETIPYLELFKKYGCVHNEMYTTDTSVMCICYKIVLKIKSYCDDYKIKIQNIILSLINVNFLNNGILILKTIISEIYLLEDPQMKKTIKEYLLKEFTNRIFFSVEDSSFVENEIIINLLFEDDIYLDTKQIIKLILEGGYYFSVAVAFLKKVNEKYPDKIDKTTTYEIKNEKIKKIFDELQIPYIYESDEEKNRKQMDTLIEEFRKENPDATLFGMDVFKLLDDLKKDPKKIVSQLSDISEKRGDLDSELEKCVIS